MKTTPCAAMRSAASGPGPHHRGRHPGIRAVGRPALGTDLIRDEYLTNGVVETSPFEVLAQMEGDMRSTLDAIRGAGLEVTTLAQRWNAFLGDNNEQLIRIVDKTELALESVNRVMISVDDILGDPQLKDQLRDSLEQVPHLFSQAQETLAAVQNTLSQFNGVALARNVIWPISRNSPPRWANGARRFRKTSSIPSAMSTSCWPISPS